MSRHFPNGYRMLHLPKIPLRVTHAREQGPHAQARNSQWDALSPRSCHHVFYRAQRQEMLTAPKVSQARIIVEESLRLEAPSILQFYLVFLYVAH